MSIAEICMNSLPTSADHRRFLIATTGLAAVSLLLAGWLPIAFSIAIVFFFAGPHNWFELRYFLSRLPSRLGPLRPFVSAAAGGVLTLVSSYLVLAWCAKWGILSGVSAVLASAAWLSLLCIWIAVLGYLRSREDRRRSGWLWIVPSAFTLAGMAWLYPGELFVALVYAHPLIGLWILDRELCRRPAWRLAFRKFLILLPVMLVALWCQLSTAASLAVDDLLTLNIVRQSGGSILSGVSSHLLVSTHAFLEMLHYGVWIVGIPMVTMGLTGLRLKPVAPERRSPRWRLATGGILAAAAFAVVVLWLCFLCDYTTTREVYFRLAMIHVLAEIPFLIRVL